MKYYLIVLMNLVSFYAGTLVGEFIAPIRILRDNGSLCAKLD